MAERDWVGHVPRDVAVQNVDLASADPYGLDSHDTWSGPHVGTSTSSSSTLLAPGAVATTAFTETLRCASRRLYPSRRGGSHRRAGDVIVGVLGRDVPEATGGNEHALVEHLGREPSVSLRVRAKSVLVVSHRLVGYEAEPGPDRSIELDRQAVVGACAVKSVGDHADRCVELG